MDSCSAARDLTKMFAASVKRKRPHQSEDTEKKELFWRRMKVAELKEQCKIRGLRITGNKTLLVWRLIDFETLNGKSDDESESENSEQYLSDESSDDGLMMSPPASKAPRNMPSTSTSESRAMPSKLANCKWANEYLGCEKDLIIEMANGLGGGYRRRSGISFLRAYSVALGLSVQQFTQLISAAPGKLSPWWREAVEGDIKYADNDKEKKECTDFLKALDAENN